MTEHMTVPQLKRATQQAQEWIKALGEHRAFENEEQAYSYLRAVLHAVRDRLTVEEAAHFGSQLPMVIRGFYFEGWRPALAPNEYETPQAFYERVQESLGPGAPTPSGVPITEGTAAVIELLDTKVDAGQMEHVRTQLPEEIVAEIFAGATQA